MHFWRHAKKVGMGGISKMHTAKHTYCIGLCMNTVFVLSTFSKW
jgi:hypothetical protein